MNEKFLAVKMPFSDLKFKIFPVLDLNFTDNLPQFDCRTSLLAPPGGRAPAVHWLPRRRPWRPLLSAACPACDQSKKIRDSF